MCIRDSAQRTYAFIVSFSKVGGVLLTGCVYAFLKNYSLFSNNFNETTKIQLVLLVASLLLVSAGLFLFIMIKKLNLDVFNGYNTKIVENNKKTGAWTGIKILFQNKYVFYVFLLVFLGDVISEIVNYKRILIVVDSKASSLLGLSHALSELYLQMIYMHAIGLALSMIVTNSIMRLLRTRVSLFVMPALSLLFALTYVITGADSIIIWLYIILKACSYTIGTPIRESLYIVTSSDVQFKAKFAIDAVGNKLARNTGQGLNYLTNVVGKHYGAFVSALALNTVLVSLPVCWLFTAYFVGKIYNTTLKKNKVIG